MRTQLHPRTPTLTSLLSPNELVAILEAAEDGKIANPIPPVRAETSVEHFVANIAVEDLLQAEIDAAQVALWAA